MKNKLARALCLVLVCSVVFVGLALSKSSVRASADKPSDDAAAITVLKDKVARLEKQVADLQKQVTELRKYRIAHVLPSPQQIRPGQPPNWPTFQFDGRACAVYVEQDPPGQAGGGPK